MPGYGAMRPLPLQAVVVHSRPAGQAPRMAPKVEARLGESSARTVYSLRGCSVRATRPAGVGRRGCRLAEWRGGRRSVGLLPSSTCPASMPRLTWTGCVSGTGLA